MFKINATIWINGHKGIKQEQKGAYDNLQDGISNYKRIVSDISLFVSSTDKGYGVVQLFDEYDKKVFEFSCHGSNYLTPFVSVIL